MLSISSNNLSTFSPSSSLKGSFDSAQRAGGLIENGYRKRRMSETCPHIAGSIAANTNHISVASLTTADVHDEGHNWGGEAGKPQQGGLRSDAALEMTVWVEEKQDIGGLRGRFGRKGPREQTYQRRYAHTSSMIRRNNTDSKHSLHHISRNRYDREA